MVRSYVLVLGVTSMIAGCRGVIGEGDELQPPGTIFQCDPSVVPPELPLRRLSERQYRNSIRDLIPLLSAADAPTIQTEIASAFAAYPVDSRSGPDEEFGGLRRLDQSLYQETANGAYSVGQAVAKALLKPKGGKRTRLTSAAGACATDTATANDGACLEAFIRSFGGRVLRRPLTADDVAFYTSIAGTTIEPEDYGDVVAVLLSAPRFLYFVEEGQEGTNVSPVPLTAYELASRLSYQFWQTLPDDELRAAAEDGSLLDDSVYTAQVDRLAADPRAADGIRELFGDWLEPTFLGPLEANIGTPDFDAFRGNLTPTPELREHMVEELARMGQYYALETEASFSDFFRSDRSFAETEDLAAIYQTPVWSSGEPPKFTDPGREGILSRAAITATGFVTTRPIMKGVFARKVILCDPIGEPPADVMDVVGTLPTVGVTSRGFAESISQVRADCAGCHKKIINPLGFPSENYDGLGRARTTEAVYSPAGELLANAPIDTTSIPYVRNDGSPEDESTMVTSVAELDQVLLASTKPQACFARRYFRFTFGRVEDKTHRDDCALSEMYSALVDGKSMTSVVRMIALRSEFRTRTLQ